MPLSVDRTLVEEARNSGAALEQLIIAVWPEAYRIAFAILRDAALAEDAAQEACTSLALSLVRLHDPSAFRTWSYRIMTNAAVSVARRKVRTERLDAARTLRQTFDNAELVDLDHALGCLSPVQRAVVLLHYYAGLNSAEIAAALHVASSTIRFHLMVARRALRRALDETVQPSPDREKETASYVS